jgi:hypothetical protein
MSEGQSYLTFGARPSPTGKTKIVSVCSRSSGELLGEIRWFGRWRQYCFYPERGTIFNHGCMGDICAHIEGLRQARLPSPLDEVQS